jgi:hypothetical protein
MAIEFPHDAETNSSTHERVSSETGWIQWNRMVGYYGFPEQEVIPGVLVVVHGKLVDSKLVKVVGSLKEVHLEIGFFLLQFDGICCCLQRDKTIGSLLYEKAVDISAGEQFRAFYQSDDLRNYPLHESPHCVAGSLIVLQYGTILSGQKSHRLNQNLEAEGKFWVKWSQSELSVCSAELTSIFVPFETWK